MARYDDFVADQWEGKLLRNLNRASYTGSSGDSGAPVYVYLTGPPPRVAAVGVASAGTGPSYFYPTSYLGNELGAHIWLG
jgi:hypothetical protein